MATIAEGVESSDELEFLRQHDIDSIQGYYYYKPMDIATIESLFQKTARFWLTAYSQKIDTIADTTRFDKGMDENERFVQRTYRDHEWSEREYPKVKSRFPSEYNRIYSEKARSHHVELKPNQIVTSEMLDEKMVRHLITLSKCTDDAIDAIEHEDKQTLKTLLLQTKALQEEIHELQKIVYEDSLTKSYNRKWFEDTICDSDRISIRESGTLVMADLNKFKQINDTYGHVVGDKVLIHIAFKLKESGGRVVRYGGDEFMIIFDAKVS